MIYGSVCSGIEAATVAWESLLWEPAWFSEIEKFPSSVLAYRYPKTSNLGDMTKLYENETFRARHIDLLAPESCPVQEDGILAPFSGRFKNSGMGSPIESWTLNTLEYPKDVVESLLSDILETIDLPLRYFLSPKACAGISRTACCFLTWEGLRSLLCVSTSEEIA